MLLAWGAHKQHRVTHSSFAAETCALLDGMRAAIEVACVLAHLTHGDDTELAPIDSYTDSLSLFSTLSTTGIVKPMEFNAGVAALRGMYDACTTPSVKWLPAAGQLADSLAKPSSSASLRRNLFTGCYGLSPVGTLTMTQEADQADADPTAGSPTRT